jgi:hypothetical protein
MRVKCLTPGCKALKEMRRRRPFRCFKCKEKIAQERSLAYYHKHHHNEDPEEKMEVPSR